MYKKIITVLVSCAMLSTLALTGCGENSTTTTDNNPTSATTESTATEAEPTEQTTDTAILPTDEQPTTTTEATTPTDSDNAVVINEVEEGTFEYVDETVTNPTVAPIETPDESATASGEVTATTLAGTWKPLMAVSVADGKEANFQDIYGSSFTQYGGSLIIADDASFTISMGASITDDKSSGTFTMSQYNMLVTYADGSADTYLYIPTYQNRQVIKTQVDDYYIYFYKEA